MGFKEDITEKTRLARELDSHRHHLEELVDHRTSQLSEALKKADAANVAKSSFLANMSHEIRTPMNAITGLTQLLKRDNPTPKQLGQLSKIDTSAEHLLSIINDILDLSKIEAGKMTLELMDFHLEEIFDQILVLFKVQLKAKNLRVVIDTTGVSGWLIGDPSRLRQALLNYVGNAIKFTEQGTITLRARTLEERTDGVTLRFEVQDTGIGIDSNKLEELFSPFEQSDVTTTRKFGGSGLGLTITRRLAELMGGETGAESESGHGSTFWFSARFALGHKTVNSEKPDIHEDAEARLRRNCEGATILLAEDNAINSEVASGLLRGTGLMVDTVENGVDALEMVRSKEYDLILMDIQMPQMDGLEATRLIRTMKGRQTAKSELPILAMTANVFEEDRRACVDAGMNDFVAKPFRLKELFSTIDKWLTRDKPTDNIVLEVHRPHRKPTSQKMTAQLIPRL